MDINNMDINMRSPRQSGFGLLEVLIAIVIFAIGMLALATLQGSLTRASADANLRTTAANIAERTIENLRGFGLIDTDPNGEIPAYNDIVDLAAEDVTAAEEDEPEGQIIFTRSIDVTDFYYILATDTFTDTAPLGIAVSDFKEVAVTVAWGGGAGFQIDESNTVTSAELGSGSVLVTAFISSASTQGSARVSSQEEGNDFDPFINYTPGENPDIVSLMLADGRFKESLTPEPEVTRLDELVETRFDVITYSQADGNALFLRREEFIAVSCECILNEPPGDGSLSGRRPILWAGDEYIEPEFIVKAYGESNNNQQSAFCNTCCQDHHDGGSGAKDPANDAGAILFNPYRASADYFTTGAFTGDHKHYSKDQQGNLSVATSNGAVYVEACRLVRKDGFLRVQQDFSMESLNVFPFDYLVSEADVEAYSDWVTGVVSDFTTDLVTNGYASSASYPFIAPDLGNPDRTAFGDSPLESDLTNAYTSLPTPLNAQFQQLRSRGVYVDYMTTDLRAMLGCLASNDVDTCNANDYGDVFLDKTGSGNLLEIIPFFEVQLTFLNRWTSFPIDTPVSVSNEPLETNNTHDRGIANQEQISGQSTITATGHDGNLGFTDTDPIDPNFSSELVGNVIEVILDNVNPPPPNGVIVTAIITSGVNGVQAASVEIEATDAFCNRTNTGFICLVPFGSTTASIKLSNYFKQNDNDISACQSDPSMPSIRGNDNNNRPWTLFDLNNAVDTFTYQISIENGSCGG